MRELGQRGEIGGGVLLGQARDMGMGRFLEEYGSDPSYDA